MLIITKLENVKIMNKLKWNTLPKKKGRIYRFSFDKTNLIQNERCDTKQKEKV